MKPNFSLKTFVAGVLAGTALFAVIGAATAPARNPLGRFQISASGTGVAYVLDTSTGQVWSNTTHAQEFATPKVP